MGWEGEAAGEAGKTGEGDRGEGTHPRQESVISVFHA